MPEIKGKCPGDVIECDDRCWNWLPKHTYRPFGKLKQPWKVPTNIWFVNEIKGKLNGGPSELEKDISINLEVKEHPSGQWVKIATYDVLACIQPMTPFKANVNKVITGIRFVAPDENRFVDLSEWTIDGIPLGVVNLVLEKIGIETGGAGFLTFENIDGIQPGEKFKIHATLKNIGDPGSYRIMFGSTEIAKGTIDRNETIDVEWPSSDWQIMSSSVAFKGTLKVMSQDSINDKWNTSNHEVGVPLNIKQKMTIISSGIKKGLKRTWQTFVPGGIPSYAEAIVKNEGNVPSTGRLNINGVNYSITNLSPGGTKTIIHAFSPQHDKSLLVRMKMFTLISGGEKLTHELTKNIFVKTPRFRISMDREFFKRPITPFKIPFTISLLNHSDYKEFGSYPKVKITTNIFGPKTEYVQFTESINKVNMTVETSFLTTEGARGTVVVAMKNPIAEHEFKIFPFDVCYIIDDVIPGITRNCRARIQTYAGDFGVDIQSVGFTKGIYTNSGRGGLGSSDDTASASSDENGEDQESDESSSIGIYRRKIVNGSINPFNNLGYIFEQAMAFGIEFTKPMMVVFPNTGKYFIADKIKWIGGRIRYQSSEEVEEQEDEAETQALREYHKDDIVY